MDAVWGFLSGVLVVAGVIGVIILVLVIFAIIYIVRRVMFAVRGEDYVPLFKFKKKQRPYVHQDVDAGATADSINDVLRRYQQNEMVGKYARKAMSNLADMERKAAYLHSVLDAKFQRGSLSWEKFAVAADSSEKAILRNCSALANRIQTFDSAEYKRLERASRLAERGRGPVLDATDAEKHALLRTSVSDMEAIEHSNAQLLLELDKLSAELGKLADADTSEKSERIVEEIRTLIDETKYYA